jgi:Icc-related predicted phosphoesterase
MTIAAVGDIHIKQNDGGKYKAMFQEISQKADVLLLCGDLTERGRVMEAEVLAGELRACTIPVIGVLGNHDHDSDKQDYIVSILDKQQVKILDGESVVIDNIGFAGVKGFGGGFDKYLLVPLGERSLKTFLEAAINDSVKLEKALMDLETEKKIVVMHYSPIRQTIEGEPLEIYPMLGSSRFVEPINRFQVQGVFHGHAHHGTIEGKTEKGIPVFNVAMHLLQAKQKDHQPYMIWEV